MGVTFFSLDPVQKGGSNLKAVYKSHLTKCPCPEFSCDIGRRRQTSCSVARLLLMALIDPLRNSTPVFGSVAFCTTNIRDFKTPLTSTASTILSTYSINI